VGFEIDIVDELDFVEKENKKDKQDNNNVTNSFLVNSHLPFPVSGEYFNPSYVIEPQKEFEFELIKYLETKSNKPPIPIPVHDNPENNSKDLSDVITGTIELTFPDDVIQDDITLDDVISDDPTTENNSISDGILMDDIIPDDITTDDPIPEDVIPEDVLTSNNLQTTQDNNSTIPVIIILVAVLGIAGFLIWKKPSFVWKGKNKNKQNITKTKISFDDKINLEIQTISDSGAKL